MVERTSFLKMIIFPFLPKNKPERPSFLLKINLLEVKIFSIFLEKTNSLR